MNRALWSETNTPLGELLAATMLDQTSEVPGSLHKIHGAWESTYGAPVAVGMHQTYEQGPRTT
jgi:hypothetical protein